MGFIDTWEDVKDMAEETVKFILKQVQERNAEFKTFKSGLACNDRQNPDFF